MLGVKNHRGALVTGTVQRALSCFSRLDVINRNRYNFVDLCFNDNDKKLLNIWMTVFLLVWFSVSVDEKLK